VNGKFWCDVLRRLRENIQRKYPNKWCNNSPALNHDNTPAHVSLVVKQFLASKNMTVVLHPPYSPDLAPPFFPIPKDEIEIQGVTF
jgi:histone-lysine N-methyltransferase SETMAR